ncbi:Hypothetical protein NTJ_07448 [Nesidiocoris tenuis]|uniref:Uncharacterized protein n=2 Tax=Nesidiocoris tenuis TaxID=355587 RepID=A0ABN7AT43_9HEMI|nr:Hypothetical protein NTJ_07448 [Nesidiocoris tenuis]
MATEIGSAGGKTATSDAQGGKDSSTANLAPSSANCLGRRHYRRAVQLRPTETQRGVDVPRLSSPLRFSQVREHPESAERLEGSRWE